MKLSLIICVAFCCLVEYRAQTIEDDVSLKASSPLNETNSNHRGKRHLCLKCLLKSKGIGGNDGGGYGGESYGGGGGGYGGGGYGGGGHSGGGYGGGGYGGESPHNGQGSTIIVVPVSVSGFKGYKKEHPKYPAPMPDYQDYKPVYNHPPPQPAYSHPPPQPAYSHPPPQPAYSHPPPQPAYSHPPPQPAYSHPPPQPAYSRPASVSYSQASSSSYSGSWN